MSSLPSTSQNTNKLTEYKKIPSNLSGFQIAFIQWLN